MDPPPLRAQILVAHALAGAFMVSQLLSGNGPPRFSAAAGHLFQIRLGRTTRAGSTRGTPFLKTE